ncbi:hypothetical protein B0H16DRAFT_1346804 [Mycena metata]|uniref:Uncharacterized protein n=1 Tax=Mycena metata TaxID=1033252 RepID=A0AAD7GSD4_9AGAR|nr:hypothetical protein B0H16DRAFT_1346804 [Mycena metata]
METDTAVTSPEGENRTGTNIPVCPPAAASWFRTVYSQISVDDLGGAYNALLLSFTQLERVYRWSQSPGQLPVVGRPGAIGKWVTAGRGGRGRGGPMGQGRGPNIGTSAEFATEWWTWWGLLQPAWRTRDAKNPLRFLRTGYPATHGDWGVLRQPGQNGVLSLVAGVYWWGKKLLVENRSEDRESWEEAVADLKWVVDGLRAAEIGEGGSEIESDELRTDVDI